MEKTSRIARFCHAKRHHASNCAEKTFVYSHKTAKFAKVFSLKSFPLYAISESQWTLWLGNAKVKTWPGVYLVLLWMFFTVVLLYLLVEGWLQRSSCFFTQEVQLCIQGYLLLCKYFLLNQTENHPQHCMHLHFLKTVHSFCVIPCPVLLLITIIGNITTIR